VPAFGEHRFRVELHARERELAVLKPMMMPDAVVAVTSSSSGTVGVSTASE